MGVEGSQNFVHLGYPMWDYFHSLALYLWSPSRLSHLYGVFLVSTGRVRIDMVFSERGETSKVEPCVQDNAWPTNCKFFFPNNEISTSWSYQHLYISWQFFDQEAFENSPGSLLVFSCELFMMHFYSEKKANLLANFWHMDAITTGEWGQKLASCCACYVVNWFAQLNSFSGCSATRQVRFQLWWVRFQLYQTFEVGQYLMLHLNKSD
jgi:hypothetical protein